MSSNPEPRAPSLDFDSGLRALCGIAAYYRIAAEPSLLQREFALGGRVAEMPDLLRAAKRLGPKAREVRSRGAKRTIELAAGFAIEARDLHHARALLDRQAVGKIRFI